MAAFKRQAAGCRPYGGLFGVDFAVDVTILICVDFAVPVLGIWF